ncbi:putative baseplate assembly protein [Halogeometricum borinquense]|uniref:putative baseplate assembly protein n=1 Tax=Halogeometricum borinquense TaxID=60847 RepID=UPI0034122790
MGIDIPELDDRSYEEYLEQAKKLIPAYSDEWTDFNPHDPGITILEVLAWVTETHTYQLDQITDDHREKYLQLMGEHRRLQEPASAQLSLSPPDAAVGERLQAGTRFLVTDGTNDTYRFETDHDIVLTDVSLERVVTVGATGRTDNSQENGTDGMFYRAFGNTVERGDTLYIGFDGDPFAAAESLTLAVDYHDADLPEPTEIGSDDVSFEPSVELQWEYLPPDGDSWMRLNVAADGTKALYESGAIELTDPEEWRFPQGDGDLIDIESSDLVWVRCRVETAGYEIPPQLDRIQPNVVSASHRVTVTNERLEQVASLGEPTALDGQTYKTEHTSILSADVRVNGERFVEVPDFDASGPTDPHYCLDRDAGQITFGDGEHGSVPPADATVTADYVYGGGDEGNVSPTAVWQFEDPTQSLTETTSLSDIEITATSAATGGTDRETITEALERVRQDLRTPYRGVTVDDYEAIASRTPGVRVGQTNVLVDGEQVTVVVVPYAPPDISTPKPSDGFLDTVRQHVTQRAMLGDQVTISGPTYVGLDITVSGQARLRYTDNGYEADIRAAIESFVHPLIGFDGDGWPFGRSLKTTEIAEQVTALDGIDHVSDVEITAHGGTTIDGTVSISDQELFSVVNVSTNLEVPTTDDRGR